MDGIIAIIRALVSSKKDISINEVAQDFYQFEGYKIPFERFGYNCLRDFLESSDKFHITKYNGEYKIAAKATNESAHISKFVAEQKRSKKKRPNTIPQRKLRTTQNLESTAYSNIYSKLPSRSVSKHIIINRSRSTAKGSFDTNTTSNMDRNFKLKVTINEPNGSGKVSPVESTMQNNIINNNNNSSKKQNIEPKIERLLKSRSVSIANDRLKDNADISGEKLESKSARRMWRQNSSPSDMKNVNTTTNLTSLNSNSKMSTNPVMPIDDNVRNNNRTNVSNLNTYCESTTTGKSGSSKSKSVMSRLQITEPVLSTVPVLPAVQSCSSPVADKKKLTIDVIYKLEIFCADYNHTKPVYTTFKVRNTPGYFCRVVISDMSYSTFPNEYGSEYDAKRAVSQKALNHLEKLIAKYPICKDSESELAIKIYESIKTHTNGIVVQNVPEYFEKMYNQSLPNDWLRLTENLSQLFSFNISNNPKIIYANAEIDSSNVTIQLDNDFQLMDKLILPWNEKHWNIFITNPVSTVEIWGRLVGPEYSDKMDALVIEIELSLMSNKKIATKIDLGCIYLVIISECSYRVRVDRFDQMQKKCLCFLIDVGEEEWFSVDEILICENQFFTFPAQAICFSLFGLEDFAENPHAKKHVQETLAARILIGDILTQHRDYIAMEEKSDTTPKIRVGLYDTSSDEDVCLKHLLLQNICNNIEPPKLNKTGATDVIITHIKDTGDVFLQVASDPGISFIEKIIHDLTENDITSYKRGIGNDKTRALYLIFDPHTKKWYRAQIKTYNGKECLMHFVDYGMERRVDSNSFYRLDALSDALNLYPHQALKVKLFGVHSWTDSLVSALRGYLTINNQALVEIVTHSSVPEVNIFEKSRPLSCINEAIKLEEEIYNSSEIMLHEENELNTFNNEESKKINEIMDCSLPKAKTKFNVLVTMCSNPSNFRICAYDKYGDLYYMMHKLQEHCTNNVTMIDSRDIQVGRAYAGLHSDGNWYRVIIDKNFNDSTVSAFCCDYGEIMLIHTNQLQRLPIEFMTLPKQAINASLYGIKPNSNDWEIEDCLYFQELVSGKSFASTVENIDNNKLELTLIDVATNEDIYINKKLILEGRASFKSNI